jgi:hypothetical protein
VLSFWLHLLRKCLFLGFASGGSDVDVTTPKDIPIESVARKSELWSNRRVGEY